MSDNLAANVLLIGTGPMAVDYVKVLKASGVSFTVIGRGKESATLFQQKTAVTPLTGGLDDFLSQTNEVFSHAIVATGVEGLLNNTIALLNHQPCTY
jgi:D-arabinose 1-dehydrogenase-like Zn-dependent alcohol dehydrogenase